jgi:hypothetical protein
LPQVIAVPQQCRETASEARCVVVNNRTEEAVRSNNSLQADKGKLSRHLRAHMARQLAFAAELSRYVL